jgi:hypothetical protein
MKGPINTSLFFSILFLQTSSLKIERKGRYGYCPLPSFEESKHYFDFRDLVIFWLNFSEIHIKSKLFDLQTHFFRFMKVLIISVGPKPERFRGSKNHKPTVANPKND